ncbi:farnesyl pyrophosphate synthase-like isoform X2 [Helicoverpa zea]|uniref:farnesyl pyrophosphate synthase-like isoform X2 n=1 Tax=Helicoverpa zea TaxID=7113 RepID=UPI001F56E374|nr:farnesyl pyrophosphate synthase-like isoform X2 [Helicoverpa zea]XP_047031306.1 farnesyl pyrophosphate synthase-like isoform X2 [Helicoverpa zea]
MALLLRKTLFFNQIRTLHKTPVKLSTPITFKSDINYKKFDEVRPEVMKSLMSSPKFTKQLPEVDTRIKEMLDYTMHGGKRSTGLSVPFGYQIMEDPKYFVEEKLHTARFLGWCLEILHANLLTIDDILDANTTRRGLTCWYLRPEVGTSATNDSMLIYLCLMEVLQINFEKEPYYVDLIKIIHDTAMYTGIGQYLEYSSSYMKNGKERDLTEQINICFEVGKLLQYQNDFKDVYWDKATYGKDGTDIQEGKLSWIAITALERCNEAQRSIFKEYYGSKDPEHVKQIKQLYDELQMDKMYAEFEHSFYENMKRRIYTLPTEGEIQYFLQILEVCRQRAY